MTRLFKILILIILEIDNNKVVKNNNNKTNKMIRNLFKFKKLKNNKFEILIYISNIKAIKNLIFLTFNIKKVFNCLK